MTKYEENALNELKIWHKNMLKPPSITNRVSKFTQNKFNNLIPDKVHSIITSAIKNMVKTVILGSELTAKDPLNSASLQERDQLINEKAKLFRNSAALTGAGTGAAGLIIGLADFPILLSIKIKFLYEIAAIYGFDANNYKERIFILNIFQLAFCSQDRRRIIYNQILTWNFLADELPEDINLFDWRTFQQEYRDYIDLAKLFQLVPGIGAFVGAYVNYKLINKLTETAKYSYRMRLLNYPLENLL